MSALLNLNELAAALGYSRSWVSRRPEFCKRFQVRQPEGQRKYSRVLVDKYVSGESLVAIGKGARTDRRVSA